MYGDPIFFFFAPDCGTDDSVYQEVATETGGMVLPLRESDISKLGQCYHGYMLCYHGNMLCNHGNMLCYHGYMLCYHGYMLCYHGIGNMMSYYGYGLLATRVTVTGYMQCYHGYMPCYHGNMPC